MRARVPKRIRQIPTFIRNAMWRNVTMRRPKQNRKFHVVYFTCRPDAGLLFMSLHSLKNIARDHSLTVNIFMDESNPLTTAQVGIIEELWPSVNFTVWGKGRGWGHVEIGNIWRAYEHVASFADSDDFITKIDSDVFFIDDRIFELTSRLTSDLIGDAHYDDGWHAQGGCYFLKVSAVQKILEELVFDRLNERVSAWPRTSEDFAATTFVRDRGLSFRDTFFMGSAPELKSYNLPYWWFRKKFSCAHFIRDHKHQMRHEYVNHFCDEASRREVQDYLQRLSQTDERS